jgi:NAD(P)-dependent dehydrogenase (short-subunit alcohol dehydrogenase family)
MSERVLLVSGGGRGIGAATCRLAGARGYRVAVNYRFRPLGGFLKLVSSRSMCKQAKNAAFQTTKIDAHRIRT